MSLTDLRKQVARKNEEAFTLIELMVVVLIIGVLAAIAIPVFLTQQRVAIAASVQSDVRGTVTNVATWLASHPSGLTGPQEGGLNLAVIELVQSDNGNVIWIDDQDLNTNNLPRYDNYTVNGLNPNFDGRFSYNAQTGEYTNTLMP